MKGHDKALFAAVQNGQLLQVHAALREGADVNARNDLQQTPLHWAALHNRVDIARLLIDRGAIINAKDKWRFTPRDYVVDRDAFDMIALLDTALKSAGHADRKEDRRYADETRQR